MIAILTMSAKIATLGVLRIKVFRNKDYDVIISGNDIINKSLSRDSNLIVAMVMWPKLGNSGISMREVVITSILEGFDQKNHFF